MFVRFIRWFRSWLSPQHTFRKVCQRLERGLRDGSVALDLDCYREICERFDTYPVREVADWVKECREFIEKQFGRKEALKFMLRGLSEGRNPKAMVNRMTTYMEELARSV